MAELAICWLTDSGWLNHKVVTHPASSLAQDRESSPAETSVLTTMLRQNLVTLILCTTEEHTSMIRPTGAPRMAHFLLKWRKQVANSTARAQTTSFHPTGVWLDGTVVGCWIWDQQVAGSNSSCPAVDCNPGQVVNTHVPLSPNSIIWYQPTGSNA